MNQAEVLARQAFFHGVCRGMDIILERVEDTLERREIVEQRAIRAELSEVTETVVRILMVKCGIAPEDEGDDNG